MRILLGVHHFLPAYRGGAEGQAYRMAKLLRARGHDVKVVCVERIDAGPAGGLEWVEDTYDGIPVRRLFFDLSTAPDRWRWEYDNPWVGDHLRALFTDEKFDVCHLVGGYLMTGRTLLEAYAAGIPSVVTLTDFWWLCPRIIMLRNDGHLSTTPIDARRCVRCLAEGRRRYRLPGRFAPAIMDFYWSLHTRQIGAVEARMQFLQDALQHASAIIAPSTFLATTYGEAGVDCSNMLLCRQGQAITGSEEARAVEPRGPGLRVAYTGQIAEIKGLHVLFDAARRMPDAPISVRIYGDANRAPEYTARLRRLQQGDARLEFAGAYSRPEELTQILAETDVLVVPSVWYENSPNTILEAFVYRIPVIASNLGGMAELVQDGVNGLLFTPGSAADLARQLQRLLDEPDLLPALRRGIGPVKTLDEEVDELEALYDSLYAGAHSV
jgi:glycosyltransferase involved in cell wall biosynthesis